MTADGPAGVLPTWESFNADFVEPGVPVFCVARAEPLVRLFASGNAERIGVNFAIAQGASPPASPLREIAVREFAEGGLRMVEVSTGARPLFRHFYAFMECVCEAVVREAASPLAALERALREWHSLLRAAGALSEERQIGLFGELWFLNCLIDTEGPAAVDAWVGPLRQAHDFRRGGDEFEVKTTATEVRRHHIHGLGQLRPSPDRSLTLVSIQIAPAGTGGNTLPEMAAKALSKLHQWPDAQKRLATILEDVVGLREADYPLYPKRWQLRSAPMSIPVGDGCPRLVPEALAALPPGLVAERISEVIYVIDVDGLGSPLDGPAESNPPAASQECARA